MYVKLKYKPNTKAIGAAGADQTWFSISISDFDCIYVHRYNDIRCI